MPRRPEGQRGALAPLEQEFEECVQRWRREEEHAGMLGEDETYAVLELIRGTLRLDPEERWTAQEVLACEWMERWGLPA